MSGQERKEVTTFKTTGYRGVERRNGERTPPAGVRGQRGRDTTPDLLERPIIRQCRNPREVQRTYSY